MSPYSYINFKQRMPHWQAQQTKLRRKLLRAVIHLFAWVGMAMLYYVAFSFLFDTPLEYEMKAQTRQLETEYDRLNERYDTIEKVLYNVIERDKSVFKALFEAEPYNLDAEFDRKKWEAHEGLLSKSNKDLGKEFFSKLGTLTKQGEKQLIALTVLEQQADSLKKEMDNIPSIQPVTNKELTLLTASYGMRIHPFYKSLTSHQGVDYTVAEGSRVFATADGRVRDVITKRTSSGNTVVIDHGNGYQTSYSHLGKIYVKKGQSVRRSDIIAQSGNSGLSLAPHLHYEVKHNGMRVDPIHYFFMELDYNEYQKLIKIAQSGMQSFD